MGYAVYRDPENSFRWAGYGVPAVCDVDYCNNDIDRGMAYRCEEVTEYHYLKDGIEVSSSDDWDEEVEEEVEGCNLHFCFEHLYEHDKYHEGVEAKPDIPRWSWWMFTAPSWENWRLQNPEELSALEERAKFYTTTDEDEDELRYDRENA